MSGQANTVAPMTQHWQGSFDDLGRSLAATTFVVVDLETTGGSADDCEITEIGAVKVRGGEILGEYKTFVNPGLPIPAFITVLTGITDAMVVDAPKIAELLPGFLEFAGSPTDTVFVAHNAPFDLGFLKTAAKKHGYAWPKYPVVDTVRIARQVMTKEEVPNNKLGSLAAFFGAETTPNHRALDDAKATVDVLHGLFGRLGSFGITTLEELLNFSKQVSPAQHEKRHLAANIPAIAGVYIFRNAKNEALYIGTSKNLRSRVKSYFTAAESRKRIKDMIAMADHIDIIPCATVIEAQVRELRLIQEHQPRFNRRSRTQEKAVWIKLTQEQFPRLSAVRGHKTLLDDAGWAGPFHGNEAAHLAIDAIHELLPLRQCTPRITERSMKTASPCALFDMNRCAAPCIGNQSPSSYQTIISTLQHYLHNDSRPVVDQLTRRMQNLATEERFEDAAQVRNRLSALISGISRGQRIRAFTQIGEIITAHRRDDQWEFLCIRHGRLVGSAHSTAGVDIAQTIESLSLTAERITDDGSILPASTHEEVEKILGYIENQETRIVSITDEWSLPVFSAARSRGDFEKVEDQDVNFWVNRTQRSSN